MRKEYCDISTHALREEGDMRSDKPYYKLRISTHALREEGDMTLYKLGLTLADFYPRPPRGGRLLQ